MTDDDKQAKHNARRRARKLAATKDLSTEIELIYEKAIEDWDDEEIARGRPRLPDGNFPRGPRPAWLTPALQAARQRRHRQLMADELSTFAGDALRVIYAVVMDDRHDVEGKPVVPASVRVDAAKYLVDQVIGKARTAIDVSVSNPLEDLMGGILVNPDGEASHQIIEMAALDPADDEDRPDTSPLPND